MAPPTRRLPRADAMPDGRLAAHAVSAALSPVLHGTYDAVLGEPVPKELLVAGGEGAAGWDDLRGEWGAAGRGADR